LVVVLHCGWLWTIVDELREEANGLKRIDTHSHPKMSKHFKFDPVSVERMVRMARRVGLDGLALTEHFHATDFWAVHEHLERTYPVEGGVFCHQPEAKRPCSRAPAQRTQYIVACVLQDRK